MALAAAVEGDWGCGLGPFLLGVLFFWLEADDKADRTHNRSFLHVITERWACMVFAAETNAAVDGTPSRIYT